MDTKLQTPSLFIDLRIPLLPGVDLSGKLAYDHVQVPESAVVPGAFAELGACLRERVDVCMHVSVIQCASSAGKKGMRDLSDDELKVLARRHCFAGYSLLNAGPWVMPHASASRSLPSLLMRMEDGDRGPHVVIRSLNASN